MKPSNISINLLFSFCIAGACLFLSACQFDSAASGRSSPPGAVDKNSEFEAFTEKFLTEFWRLNPSWATYIGYYQHDDQLVIPNQTSRNRELAFLRESLNRLGSFNVADLNTTNATDWALIENQLQSQIWRLTEFKEFEWNPATYNVASIFGLILNTEYKSLDERLSVISRRLKSVPEYYRSAFAQIKHPTLPHTQLAIEQNQGALKVFEELIPKALSNSNLKEKELSLLESRLEGASRSIKSYVSKLQHLEEKIMGLPKSDQRDFRIGEALYIKKFNYDIFTDYTADQLYRKALSAKDNLHMEMIGITEQIWNTYFPSLEIPDNRLSAVRQLIDRLSQKHIAREEFVEEIKRQIPIIQRFMDDNELLDSDPTRPLVVRETPEYQRGLAGASVNAPGPYDVTANTYYNVSPLDDFSHEQAESYLREYNHWILQILNIHEAIPGHYTQLVHANKSPSKIKSIFGNGAMIEGWAVYSERMMLEAGYGNDEPEMWLMYAKWNLRVVMNTILDYSVQVLGMNEEAALDLLISEAFQEHAEAEGKWRRATLSQVQLTSYFNGYTEIYEFREALKKELDDDFDLKDFHNKFLSYGSSPVPIIKRLMRSELLQHRE